MTQTLNEWFLSLPKERQQVLIEDKWTLANAAFEAQNEKLERAIQALEQIVERKIPPLYTMSGNSLGYLTNVAWTALQEIKLKN